MGLLLNERIASGEILQLCLLLSAFPSTQGAWMAENRNLIRLTCQKTEFWDGKGTGNLLGGTGDKKPPKE